MTLVYIIRLRMGEGRRGGSWFGCLCIWIFVRSGSITYSSQHMVGLPKKPRRHVLVLPSVPCVCRLPAWCARAVPLPRSQAEQQMQNSAKVKYTQKANISSAIFTGMITVLTFWTFARLWVPDSVL
jgi:hypothetical protein